MRAALLLCLAGCWTGPVVDETARPAAPQVETTDPGVVHGFDELSLERTPCLGTCPAYTVTISADGRVAWVGRANVASLGPRVGRTTRGKLRQLERKLRAIRFDRYDAYAHKPADTECTFQPMGGTGGSLTCNFPSYTICGDTSHAIITLRRGDEVQRVDDARCERDDDLASLEAMLDDVAGTRDWR